MLPVDEDFLQLVIAGALLKPDTAFPVYHAARAKKHGFNITLERSFDPAAGEVDLFPQEIMRVFNLISNGFYAAMKLKAETDYCQLRRRCPPTLICCRSRPSLAGSRASVASAPKTTVQINVACWQILLKKSANNSRLISPAIRRLSIASR
jgi:hypothetical protein